MRRNFLFSVMATAWLGACSLTGDKPPPQPSPPDIIAPTPAPPDLPPPPPVKPPPPVRPAPIKPLPKPNSTPDELIGLDEEAVGKLLGEPAERTQDGGAMVLRYRDKDCALDVILFLDVKTGLARVLSYDLQPGSIRRPAGKSCYGQMRDGK